MNQPATPYPLDEKISKGVNSVVCRAHRAADGVPVILKALRPELASVEEVARFRREYEITQCLDLPGVIGCYEFYADAERTVMVLEDIGGRSLDRLALAGRVDLPTFLEIAGAASEALAAVHERGVIHGNLSPSNIVFNTETGQLKLIDFGCAIDMANEL